MERIRSKGTTDGASLIQWSDGTTSRFEHERDTTRIEHEDFVVTCPAGSTVTVIVVPRDEH